MADKPEDEIDRQSFHPKLYLFKKGKTIRAVIGSSNFTISGIKKNIELNIELQGNYADEPEINKIIGFFEETWNSWYSLPACDNGNLIDSYIEYIKEEKEAKNSPKITSIIDRIEQLASEATEELQADLNRDIAYMFGLMCGRGILFDKSNRKVVISFYGNILNLNDEENKGYIFAKGISDIRFPQDEALRKDAENSLENLTNLFIRAGTGDTVLLERIKERSYHLTITFSQSSPYWKKIIQLTKHLDDDSTPMENPLIPDEILNSSNNILKAFIRGYFDMRSRVSSGDSLPNGKLRIAVGIGTNAEKFGEKLTEILKNRFNIFSASYSSGKSRKKDNMIRIYPIHLNLDFFSSHWKKLLLKDFQNFNEEHFP